MCHGILQFGKHTFFVGLGLRHVCDNNHTRTVLAL